MPLSRRDLLRWQFDLTWSLLEYHMERLEPDDLWWEPTEHCWTVRRGADGETWVPDWADTEPEPVPTPTVAWVSWHLGWWWTAAIDHLRGRDPQGRGAEGWSGESVAAAAWLGELRREWLGALDAITEADLDAPARFPWQDDPEKTVAHMIAWVNAELMKNVTEIGQLRMLRTASVNGGAVRAR